MPIREETPFAAHLGELVHGVRQEWEPATGRVALELDFPSGSVRCESSSGQLRVLAVDRREPGHTNAIISEWLV